MVILTLNEIELSPPLAQSINLLSKTIKFLSTEQMKKKRKEHDEEKWEIAETPQMSEMLKSEQLFQCPENSLQMWVTKCSQNKNGPENTVHTVWLIPNFDNFQLAY